MSGTPAREVAEMFDRISPTYDLLNHLLSLGVDRRWRRTAIKHLAAQTGETILDCGAGTGDMSLTAHEVNPHIRTVLVDPALAMLTRADAKAGCIKPCQFLLMRGVAERLPFADASFDGFMVAFGIRNFENLPGGMSELCRTLKPGGRGVILEFTPDRSRWIDRIFRGYMQRVLIPIGARISRNAVAYAYLTNTVAGFLSAEELAHVFAGVGLTCRKQIRLSAGIATLFVVEKP
ncbi:ubiquinone/menaquinone biosynthesis methyltransferase [bacterium]|nr:ubiquinone/menaquinone biosynthesis methyltransferase [bacterium]MBU1984915.1 ubiquinone/menaquinone biosynthesis methyltransferase [bacterium]